jgi:Tol biopolymer transport system component/DNA-binding winged helix-turn-helix (wHTH) protein
MARPKSDVMNANIGAEYSLCGWRVQPALNRVTKDGAEVRLEPRVMQVLACLLSAGGEPVTRDVLMQDVWGHEYVTEDALNRTVSKLRRLISDELHCAAEIETIPKTGYRLVQPGSAVVAEASPPAAPSPLQRHWRWITAAAVAAALGVAFWPRGLHQGAGSVTTDPDARLVPLTTLEGKEIDPTLSPDASHVAFGWRAHPGEKYHIYVRPLSAETLLQVSTGIMNDSNPRWSPDGSQIAYIALDETRCEIMSVPPVGGPSRRIADCDQYEGDNLDWSPDGTRLAMKAPGSKGLDILNLADGNVKHFTEVPASDMLDSTPAFSPDGTLLAFVRWHAAGVANLYVVPVSGGEPKRLTFDNLKLEGLSWEPDNRHLVFSSNRGGPFGLWRVDIDGGPAERVPQSGRAAFAPVLSRDGRQLVYEEWTGQTNIFSVDGAAPGAAPRQITYTTRWNWNPSASPDGKRIAFTSDRSGASEIWVADRDGDNALKLTAFDGPYTSGPSWSPDGRHLLFDSPAVDGNFDLYEVDPDGGAPKRLTTAPAEDRFAHFSADGKWIYYSSRRSGAWEIWRMPAAGGDAQQVTFKGGYYSQPGPDGAVYFSRDWTPGVWRVKDGGEPELVVPDLEPEDCSNWVVGRDRIWYVQRVAHQPTYLASHGFAAGGPSQRLAALPLLTYKSGIGLTPDGQILLAEVVTDESDLMLLEK